MSAALLAQKTEASCAGDNTVAALLAGGLDRSSARALELHLDACPGCRQLVADLGRGLSAIARAPGGATRRLPEIGEQIGRFTVERVLGVGGMGVVYRARDRMLDRPVALKLLRPDLFDGDHLLAEAQAMARLAHGNVAVVHDIGTFHGQLYVCMEYIAGTTLRAWLGERPRPWREIVDVFRAAARGLAYVHASGLVHRDFKPENVLIGRDDRVVVSDFGLARRIDRVHHGVAVGTPAYMAPEQRRGEPADARADQYAFCLALREAVGDGAPHWLSRVLTRGLAEHRDDRFASMDALLAAIARGLARRSHGALVTVMTAAAVAAVFVPRQSEPRTRLVELPVIQRVVTPRGEPSPAPVVDVARADMPAAVAAGRAEELGARAIASRDSVPVPDVPSPPQPVERVWRAAVQLDAIALASSQGAIAAPTLDMTAASGATARDCDDGSEKQCKADEPVCEPWHVAAIQDGCWRCVDAITCEPVDELGSVVQPSRSHAHGPQGGGAGSSAGSDRGSPPRNGSASGSDGGSDDPGSHGGSAIGPDGNPL
jgi:serine/threonine-protein kinase